MSDPLSITGDLKERIKAQARTEGIAVIQLLRKIGIPSGTFGCWPKYSQPGATHYHRFEEYLKRRKAETAPTSAIQPAPDFDLPKYRFRNVLLSFHEVMFITSAIRQAPCLFLNEEQKIELILKVLPFERPQERRTRRSA